VNRLIVGLVLVLGLLPGVASAGTLCVQLDDNGDVLVMKGIGKGSKAVSGYLAVYQGGGRFQPVPVPGSSLQDNGGDLFVGLTEFQIGPATFAENMAFHRMTCRAGAMGSWLPSTAATTSSRTRTTFRCREFALGTSSRASLQ
jgi:hypothetical protein